MRNYQFVEPELRSDKLYKAMLASPYNSFDVEQEKIPPLVLQLANNDCSDKDRVLLAMRHSSYNIIYASEELQQDPEVVAWAAAPRELHNITTHEVKQLLAAYDYYCMCLKFHNVHEAAYEELVKKWMMNGSGDSGREVRLDLESGKYTTMCQRKFNAFWLVGKGARQLLWPQIMQ